MVRRIVVVVAGLLLLSGAPAGAAPGEEELSPREKALREVGALLEEGHLDEADHLIDHLLQHNPGDEGLLRLREKLRIRQGDLGEILEGGDALAIPERRDDLRRACWRVVEATATAAPEELVALAGAGDREKALAILEAIEPTTLERKAAREAALAALGDGEALDRLDARVEGGDLEALALLPTDRLARHEARIEAGLADDGKAAAAARAAGRLGRKRFLPALAKRIREGPAGAAIAAAGAILALGDEEGRRILEEVMTDGQPAWTTAALTELAAHPGKGGSLGLLKRIEQEPPIPRLRAVLLEIVLGAVGRSGEEGAREALLRHLREPATGEAAARALGELGDPDAVPALLAFLREPPKAKGTEAAAGGGMGFLGGAMGGSDVRRAAALEPRLVAALAILRSTRS